jgi:ADP-ribose diphosphatase
MSQRNKPKIIQKTILAESALFTIEGLHLHFSNGEERCYERIAGKTHGSVLIIPLLDKDTLLLIREYGGGVEDYVLAFPKGAIDFKEDLLTTANRELMEEVGYGAKKITWLTRVSASPGYMASMMDIVLAEELYPKKIEGDEPEEIEVIPWKLDKIDELLRHPEFHEARSQAALLWLLRRKMHAS